jgi:hypothetical protein
VCGGVLWFGKNRPLYGLLWAFFDVGVRGEKVLEEKFS